MLRRNKDESAFDSSTKKQPSWTISSWLTSLPLLSIIADEILACRPKQAGKTEAQFAKEAKREDVEQAIDTSLVLLKQNILKEWDGLHAQREVCASELNDKFLADDEAFQFKYGGMDLYYGGLEQFIGPPHIDISKMME
jgi:hypothetical protein